MFSKQLAEKTDVRPLTILGFRLIWAGSFTACIAIALYSRELADLMFDHEIEYRAAVGQLLIWSFVAVCITYIFSTLLTAGQQLKQMNRFFIGGIALDIVLNIILIPKYKAIGAATASVVTQCFIALCMVGLCVKIYEIRPTVKGTLQMLLFTAGTFGWAYWAVPAMGMAWYWQFFTVLASGGVLALVTGWVSLRAIP